MSRKARAASKKYSFPPASPKDIVEFFKVQLKVPVSLKDFREPREDRLKQIYTMLLSNLIHVDFEQHKRNQQRLKQELFDYPQMHERSVEIVSLVRHLGDWMRRIGVNDFGVGDLINPESSRTLRNLSAILNFAKFRHRQSLRMKDYCLLKSKLTQELKSLIIKNHNLGDEYASAVNSKPNRENLQRNIYELDMECNALRQSSELCRQSCDEMKTKLHEKEQYMKYIRCDINNEQDLIVKLDSKIVKNPEKIREELTSKTQDLTNKKKFFLLLEQKIERIMYIKLILNESMKYIQLNIDMLQKLELLINQNDNLNQQRNKKESKKIFLINELNNLEKEINYKKQEFIESKQSYESSKEDYLCAQKQVNEVEIQIDRKQQELDRSKNNHDRKIKELQMKIMVAENERNRRRKYFEIQSRLFRDEVRSLRKSLEQYHTRLSFDEGSEV